MKRIFEFFTRRHILATLFTVMIILLGINSIRTLQRDRFPNVDWGWVDILTEYQGASPEDVELNVTNKIEGALEGISGIKDVYSLSVENVSNVYVQIDPDARDTEKVKNNIRDAVGRITDFPEEIIESPFIEESTTATNSILAVGITGDLSYGELREIARELEKKLEAVPGVARLARIGYRTREIKVEVDPLAMDRYQVSLREILQAIEKRNIRLTGGTFESYTSEKNLVTLAQFSDPMEVGDVIVRSSFEGPLVVVSDLAIVRDDFEDEGLIARVGGQNAILFGVFKREDADIIRTVKAIRRMVTEESRKQRGVSVIEQKLTGMVELVRGFFGQQETADEIPYGRATVYFSDDISKHVENSFRILINNGIIGLALVLIILTLFLNLRTAFWVALGIPVSIMGACFLLPLFDSFLDTVTLTVMVIVMGIIVDDGIIISESIYQHRASGEDPIQAAVNGTHEVFLPVSTTVLTTFLAFVPMFSMTGDIGKVVWVVPLTIGLALFFSLAEALFALPSHLARGMMKRAGGVNGAQRKSVRVWFDKLREGYHRLSRRILRYRYILVGLFIAAFALILWHAIGSMDFILFPSKGAERFYLNIELPRGSSLEATVDKIEEVEMIITSLPDHELESFMGYVGRTEWGTTENSGFIGVSLTPYSARERNADQIIESLREQIDHIEGIETFVFNVDTGGPDVGKPITLRIVGYDNDERRRFTEEVKAFLTTIEGIKDIDSNDNFGKDQIEIRPKYDKLARYGLTVADVARNVRVAYDGEVVTSIRQGDEDVNIRVQLLQEARRNEAFLHSLSIPNRQGRLIKLGTVANLRTGQGLLAFRHYNGERTTTITADIDQDVVTSLEATNLVMSQFEESTGGAFYHTGAQLLIGGEAEESRTAMMNIATGFILAAIGIYFLLVLLFSSFTQPFIVLFAVPFGLIGVIIAFILHGEQPSFLGMMGVIGMSGVVVNDSLVLVSHINNLRRQNPDKPILDVIARGTADRLRAIILTSITTVAGLLPLTYGVGGVDIYMSPLALAMGYGILFATPLTLVLVPCLYAIGADISQVLQRGAGRSKYNL
jgi:multidrug efflux pump subunit AcrB